MERVEEGIEGIDGQQVKECLIQCLLVVHINGTSFSGHSYQFFLTEMPPIISHIHIAFKIIFLGFTRAERLFQSDTGYWPLASEYLPSFIQ